MIAHHNLSGNEFTHDECIELIEYSIKNDQSLMLSSRPGIGKSSIVKQAMDNAGIKPGNRVYISCGNSDGTDFYFLVLDPKTGNPSRVTVQEMRNSLIGASEPTVVVFEDIGAAPPILRTALLSICNTDNSLRYLNGELVSPHVRFVATTNRLVDSAAVTKIHQAFNDRFLQAKLVVTPDVYSAYLVERGYPAVCAAFAKIAEYFKPNYPFTAPGDYGDPGFSPRSFEEMCKLYKNMSNGAMGGIEDRNSLSRRLSMAVANFVVVDFLTMVEVQGRAQKPSEIISVLGNIDPILKPDGKMDFVLGYISAIQLLHKSLSPIPRASGEPDTQYSTRFENELDERKKAFASLCTYISGSKFEELLAAPIVRAAEKLIVKSSMKKQDEEKDEKYIVSSRIAKWLHGMGSGSDSLAKGRSDWNRILTRFLGV